jgi:hypothetical protein
MDELLEIFEFDLGELIEGGLQALIAGVLLILGTLLMLASVVVDGVFLWGVLLFVGGLVAGVFAVMSFLDVFF